MGEPDVAPTRLKVEVVEVLQPFLGLRNVSRPQVDSWKARGFPKDRNPNHSTQRKCAFVLFPPTIMEVEKNGPRKMSFVEKIGGNFPLLLGGGNSSMFYFHPYLGEDVPI